MEEKYQKEKFHHIAQKKIQAKDFLRNGALDRSSYFSCIMRHFSEALIVNFTKYKYPDIILRNLHVVKETAIFGGKEESFRKKFE